MGGREGSDREAKGVGGRGVTKRGQMEGRGSEQERKRGKEGAHQESKGVERIEREGEEKEGQAGEEGREERE